MADKNIPRLDAAAAMLATVSNVVRRLERHILLPCVQLRPALNLQRCDPVVRARLIEELQSLAWNAEALAKAIIKCQQADHV